MPQHQSELHLNPTGATRTHLMKQHTAASCFSTFILPHILFVRDFEERQKAVMSCCRVWNISLFAHAVLREQQIDMVWEMPAPSVKRVIDHRLGVPDKIEMHTKAVLGILTDEIGIEGS